MTLTKDSFLSFLQDAEVRVAFRSIFSDLIKEEMKIVEKKLLDIIDVILADTYAFVKDLSYENAHLKKKFEN